MTEKKTNKAFNMSEDERQHWEQEQEKHNEPGKRVVQALDNAINIVLTSLGVDCSDDDAIYQQMMDLGILIQEYSNLPEVAPQLQGIYIYQAYYPKLTDIVKDIKPIAFIPDPKVSSTGQIDIQIVWFDKGTLEVCQAFQMLQDGRLKEMKV